MQQYKVTITTMLLLPWKLPACNRAKFKGLKFRKFRDPFYYEKSKCTFFPVLKRLSEKILV